MNEDRRIIGHPGEQINDAIDALNMSQYEFAVRTGISTKNLNTLIKGKSGITYEIARKLAAFFDTSISFWLNLQSEYESYIRQEEEERSFERDWDIVRLFDRTFLDKICKTEFSSKNKIAIISELRSLFMVSSLNNLNNLEMFVFYKSKNNNNDEKKIILRNAWVSLALKKASTQSCGQFSQEKLLQILPKIRKLTLLKPEEFTSLLYEELAEAGIKYVELPYLKGSDIRGISRWSANEKCVVMAVNDCDRIAEKIWYTIFHELGHVLKNHKRYVTVSLDHDDSIEEKEADEFADNFLIDPDHYRQFIKEGHFEFDKIERFANEEGIGRDIVIVRLERDKLIDDQKYAFLKEQIGV